MNVKEVAERLAQQAKEIGVRFPLTFTDAQVRQEVGAALMLSKNSDGFDETTVIPTLIDKFGLIDSKNESTEVTKTAKKRKSKSKEETEDLTDETKSAEKKPRVVKVVNEGNRAVAEAIQEMAGVYFKNGDPRKGGVFSKAAKAIRESESVISSKKEAKALKGVGDGIGTYVEEFLTLGSIAKLEELRAGTA
eukprot:gene17770-23372_t